ncbi:ABC transporter ATP-binding protein [Planctomycetaceae bacterium SH139]
MADSQNPQPPVAPTVASATRLADRCESLGSRLRINLLCKAFQRRIVVDRLSLEIAAGEIVALLGPSGCGKTTLLRLIAGLEEPDSGNLEIDGQDVTRLAPHRRGVGFVFQDLALYPHLTVAENLAFPLRKSGLGRAARRQTAEQIADLLGVRPFLKRHPADLSGGERQRVAIGRGLVHRPGLLLFDEPLAHLDPHLRLQLRAELASWRKAIGGTTIYVTHDASEAMAIADRVAVMQAGRICQLGTVEEIYQRPANRFIAALLSSPSLNLLPASFDQRGNCLCGQQIIAGLQPPTPLVAAAPVSLGFRPASVRLVSSSQRAAETSQAEISQTGTTQVAISQVGVVLDRFRFHDRHCLQISSQIGSQISSQIGRGAAREIEQIRALIPAECTIGIGDQVVWQVPATEVFVFPASDPADADADTDAHTGAGNVVAEPE